MKGKVVLLVLAIIIDAMPTYLLIPVISHMIMDFGLADTRSTTGYYSAPIMGVYNLGRMVSAIPWGCFEDRYGRRPVVLISIACIAITSYTTGLALEFWSVLISRFIYGSFSPIGATSKAIARDISSGNELK